MALSTVAGLFSRRLETYLIEKRTHKAAKRQEARHRKNSEKQWEHTRHVRLECMFTCLRGASYV